MIRLIVKITTIPPVEHSAAVIEWQTFDILLPDLETLLKQNGFTTAEVVGSGIVKPPA